MSKQYRPGQKAPVSGQYEIIGPRGGRTGEERTVAKGEILPPTPERDQTYCITNHTKVHVTSRGGLYVKADELLNSPKVRKKIEDMAQFLIKRRSAGKTPKDRK